MRNLLFTLAFLMICFSSCTNSNNSNGGKETVQVEDTTMLKAVVDSILSANKGDFTNTVVKHDIQSALNNFFEQYANKNCAIIEELPFEFLDIADESGNKDKNCIAAFQYHSNKCFENTPIDIELQIGAIISRDDAKQISKGNYKLIGKIVSRKTLDFQNPPYILISNISDSISCVSFGSYALKDVSFTKVSD